MRLFEKHFTEEEANALIPFLREQFAAIHAILPQLVGEREKLGPIFNVAPHNGGGAQTAHYMRLMSQVQQRIAEILQRGILIKDLERGLVDFPHLREGREVLLCWELREADQVGYWHDVQAGYGGRHPLRGGDE